MVDDIEVKLSAEDKKSIKDLIEFQVKLEQTQRAAFGDMQKGPAGGGGFFDQIIKALSGGGKGGGIMGAGLAGGAAAGGILILADVIKEAISNSKILTTILGTIGQALGLLIDVILLPFLPLLIIGIIWLFEGIMQFYKLWNTIWTSKAVQTVGSALGALAGQLAKGIGGLLEIGLGINPAGGAVAIWEVLEWLRGLQTSAGLITLGLVFAVAGAVWDFLNWLYGVLEIASNLQLKIELTVLGAAYDFLKWLWGGLASLAVTLTGSNSGVNSALNAIQNPTAAVNDALSDPIGWAGGAINAVASSGAAGPAAQAAAATYQYFFPNYVGSKADITKAVNDANRQTQYSYKP
jgi:hypothetical protein